MKKNNPSVSSQVGALVWFSWQQTLIVRRMSCLFNILSIFIVFTPLFIQKLFSAIWHCPLYAIFVFHSTLLFNMFYELLIRCSFIMFDCYTQCHRFRENKREAKIDPLRKFLPQVSHKEFFNGQIVNLRMNSQKRLSLERRW